MKKTMLIIAMLSVVACSDNKEPNIDVNSKTAESSNISKSVSYINEFKDYSDIVIKSKTEALQILIDESIAEYEGMIDKVREDFKKNKEELEAEIVSNIKELKTEVAGIQKEFDEKCSVEGKNVKECNVIGSNLANAKNALAKTEVTLDNELGKLMASEITLLRKYQSQMKNNIAKLLAQEE